MNRAAEGFIRAGYGYLIKKQGFLIPPHSLTKVQKYKSVIKMNLDIMMSILEIIYQIK